MTSRLQEPCQAGEQAPRRFVAFKFRLHGHTQGDRSGNSRCLDREVMREGVDDGLDGVEPGVQLAGFLHLGRSRVVRCDVSFDDTGSNDTQVLVPSLAHACVTGVTGDR